MRILRGVRALDPSRRRLVFSRCLTCHAHFRENGVLEHFPRARRVAYDPERGRLWAVCRSCRRWTLAPILERWEALEELERGVTDRARLLSSTENIALHDLDGLEVVRVGDARGEEEAWWRFGEGLVRRRRKYIVHGTIGVVAVSAAVASGIAAGLGAIGVLNLVNMGGQILALRQQRRKFGEVVWRGEAPCPKCGAVLRDVRFQQRNRLILAPSEDDGGRPLDLRFRCFRCGRSTPDTGYRFEGVEAEHLLRRALAFENRRGASEREVKRAARFIEDAGGHPRAALRRLSEERPQLADVDRTGLLTLEIASGEESESRLLRMEGAALEARWREEERLAAIVDGELTPVEGLDELRRKSGGGGAASVRSS